MVDEESYWLYLRVSDGTDAACLYTVEHWFVDRPDIETTRALFE